MHRFRTLLRPRMLALGVLGLLVAIQLIPTWLLQTNPPVESEPAWANAEVRAVMKRACFDCHSNETTWPLYSRIAPMSWLVTYDVVKGRSKLNFSEWSAANPEKTGEIGEVVQRGEMPPRQYLVLHPDAKLTAAEQQQLMSAFPSTEGAPRQGGTDADD